MIFSHYLTIIHHNSRGRFVSTIFHRNLLTTHDIDPRYCEPECRARVANLYLPLIGSAFSSSSQALPHSILSIICSRCDPGLCRIPPRRNRADRQPRRDHPDHRPDHRSADRRQCHVRHRGEHAEGRARAQTCKVKSVTGACG